MSKTMGQIISNRRKALEMTRSELAEKMGITDKAASKWERDLSCPDVSSIPQLAEVLGASLEELLSVERTIPAEERSLWSRIGGIVDLVLLAVGLAEGAAITASAVMGMMGERSGFFAMLGIGMSCFGIYLLRQRDRQ